MATDKTIPISCRISVENADKLKTLLEKQGISFRNLVENLIDGVNTFEVDVNTKTEFKSVNTSHKNKENLENTGVNTTSESANTELEYYKQKFCALATRVTPEAHDNFQKEIYGLIEIVPVGAIDKTYDNVGSLPKDLYDDIMSMVSTYGMSYKEFMQIIDGFLNDGYISDDGGKLKTIDSKLDTSGFISKCDELGIKDYQSVFDRLVKSMKVN